MKSLMKPLILASIFSITISCTTNSKLTAPQRDLAQERLSIEFPKKERELLLAIINEDIPNIEKLFRRVSYIRFWSPPESKTHDYKVKLSLFPLPSSRRVEILERLHELGHDLDIADRDGRRLSHRAAHDGHADVLRLLHRLGYNTNLPDGNGVRPAAIAVRAGKADALRALHESGHINHVDTRNIEETKTQIKAGCPY